MAESEKNAIDIYIQNGFISQLARVFGVQVFLSLKQDNSDARSKLDDANSDRVLGACFVRPTQFAVNTAGLRSRPMAARGVRAGFVRGTNSDDKDENKDTVHVLHLSPTNVTYEVSFEVTSYSDLRKLWSIWSAAHQTDSLNFRLEFRDALFPVTTALSEQMDIPEKASPSEGRDDVFRATGEIIVSGYAESVQQHQVPVILYPHSLSEVKPPQGV